MVGVWKHGHGNWEAIQKDASLGLEGKFFLDDAKVKTGDTEKRNIPNSIHLVRRADYLTHLLREFDDGVGRSTNGNGTPSASNRPSVPKPRSKPKPPADRGSTSTATSDTVAARASKSKSKRPATPDYSSSDEDSVYDSMDEGECKEILRPVKRELKRLKLDTDQFSREQKVAHLKECLSAIGSRIEYMAAREQTDVEKDRRRKHLCTSPRSS